MEFTLLKPFNCEEDEDNLFCLHRGILLDKGFSIDSTIDANKSRLKRIRQNVYPLERLKEKIPTRDPELLAKYAKKNIRIFVKKQDFQCVFETDTFYEKSLIFLCKNANKPFDCLKLLFKMCTLSSRQKSKMTEVSMGTFLIENGLKWDNSHFEISREIELASKIPDFGISFFVNGARHIESKQIYKSLNEKFKVIISAESAENMTVPLTEKVLICKNFLKTYFCQATVQCGYSNREKNKVERHEKTCSNQTKFKYSQVRYPIKNNVSTELKSLGIHIDFQFLTWDIETLSNQNSFEFGKSVSLGEQKVVSIGIYGPNVEQVFLGDNCVSSFLRKIEEIQCEYFNKLPQNTKDYMEELSLHLKNKDLSPSLKSKFSKHLRFLKQMTNLYIVGFNSSRFDIPAIISEITDDPSIDPSEIKIIKNGNNFIQLTFHNLTFLDARLFCAGGSLQSFGETFGATQEKSVFPYELYKCLDEMYTVTTFPSISKFKSSLTSTVKINKNEIDEINNIFRNYEDFKRFLGFDSKKEIFVNPLTYIKCKNLFDEKISNGEWTSFVDFLNYYNLKDCEILYDAFNNYRKVFAQTFGIEVLTRLTLPSIAEGKK